MKLTDLIVQHQKLREEIIAEVRTAESVRPVDGHEPAYYGSVEYWQRRARKLLNKIRRLINNRMKVRQRLARTLALHPDVVELLAERQAARLRVSILTNLRSLSGTSAMSLYGSTDFIEEGQLLNSWLEEWKRLADEELSAIKPGQHWRRSSNRALSPLPPAGNSSSFYFRNHAVSRPFKRVLDFNSTQLRLEAARRQLKEIERRMDELGALYDAEE